MTHFLAMRDEPVFFFLEIPTNKNEENLVAPKKVETYHKDVYYLDGCSLLKAVSILDRFGNILFNDGFSSFGFGGHLSGDEIMFGKYNFLDLSSENIDKFSGFFEAHGIKETESLKTAWSFFSETSPGISNSYEEDRKTVYDLPELLKEEGLYFAERREDD